jgi:hypothetical protein
MIRLTDQQMDQIKNAAVPIPPRLRQAYLQRVADQLSGKSFDDGDVFRASRDAQRESPALILRTHKIAIVCGLRRMLRRSSYAVATRREGHRSKD